jgi:hypothetical protein
MRCKICGLDSAYHDAVMRVVEQQINKIEYLVEQTKILGSYETDKKYVVEANTIIKYHFPKIYKLLILQ